jgi:pimeloyl-ACP methyl ester carboxylesterase
MNMPFVEIEGERTYYQTGGSKTGKTLIAIHGSGGDHTLWPVELRTLPTARVCAIDLPGHGRSGGSACSSVDAYADFIELFVSQLDFDDVTLIGHSLGGAIVQALALRAPEWLCRIILVGTGARLRVEPGILDGCFSNFAQTIDLICDWAYGPAASKDLIDRGRARLLKTPAKVIHADMSACNRFDVIKSVHDIRLPTLVVSGSHDQLTPLKYGEYLHSNIAGSTHTVIENGGHMMALEKPDEFINSVIDFLGS